MNNLPLLQLKDSASNVRHIADDGLPLCAHKEDRKGWYKDAGIGTPNCPHCQRRLREAASKTVRPVGGWGRL